ncbi:MAG TPA: nucleotide kinase [Clostridiales bacterium]|nr:nucleotide kinase [Clostridiales bacterium]
MKHIFLTGEIRIGKSTVIKKTLSLLGAKCGGFQTYFSENRLDDNRRLYIGEFGQLPSYDDEYVVARFQRGQAPCVLTERFDILGAQYILNAAKAADLIVMDELGKMERHARRFQSAVLESIEGRLPVFGVIRNSAGGWLNQIRQNPGVTIITVDEKNRDSLPELLARELSRLIKC